MSRINELLGPWKLWFLAAPEFCILLGKSYMKQHETTLWEEGENLTYTP